jgi:hypothetical protein
METNNDTPAQNFDICDSLDELSDVRKKQAILKDVLTLMKSEGPENCGCEIIVSTVTAEVQKLEFEAAAVGCEIIGEFMTMRDRIKRLEEDLSDAREELSMERNRSTFYQRMHEAVSRQ